MKNFNKPIDFCYPQPSSEAVTAMKQNNDCCIVHKQQNIIPMNVYYKDGRQGTQAHMLTRKAVLIALHKVAKQLLPEYGLLIFDTFRSLATQADLFNSICEQVKKQHLDWDKKSIEQQASKFAANPNDPSRFSVLPHNSGGAVDLTIYDIKKQQPCPLGGDFDEVSDFSKTNFFEQEYDPTFEISATQWKTYRTHRRMLYHVMIDAGFVNYCNEWWHYDLGNCLWAEALHVDWIFGSMEQDSS